jgi:hypothetical protein
MYIKRDGMIIKDDYLYIPMDAGNRHYKEYLKWAEVNGPAPEYVPLVPKKTSFTSLEWQDLFTLEERIAIRQVAMTDMEVGLVYDMSLSAQVIDIYDPRTAAGLNVLVSRELLTEARKNELLQIGV